METTNQNRTGCCCDPTERDQAAPETTACNCDCGDCDCAPGECPDCA